VSLRSLFLDAVRRDADELCRVAQVDPRARVPACPDWDLRLLVDHVGRVHHWVDGIVRSRRQERLAFADQPGGPEELEAVLRWCREGTASMLATLQEVGEEEPVWNWIQGVAPARSWMRRMALETSIHRWDAQSAIGGALPIDTEVARHGVDEMCDDVLALLRRHTTELSTDASIHLHCTDTEGEWLVRFTPGGAVATHEHAKGDVAVRATASDLYLLLWNRITAEHLEVFGDASLLRRWADVVRI